MEKSAASSNHQQFAPDEITSLTRPSAPSRPDISLWFLWRSWRKADIESKIELGVTPLLTDAAAAGEANLRPHVCVHFPPSIRLFLIEGSDDLRRQPRVPHSEEDLCPHHSSAGCLLIKRCGAEWQAGAGELPFVKRCAADSCHDWREGRKTGENFSPVRFIYIYVYIFICKYTYSYCANIALVQTIWIGLLSCQRSFLSAFKIKFKKT